MLRNSLAQYGLFSFRTVSSSHTLLLNNTDGVKFAQYGTFYLVFKGCDRRVLMSTNKQTNKYIDTRAG